MKTAMTGHLGHTRRLALAMLTCLVLALWVVPTARAGDAVTGYESSGQYQVAADYRGWATIATCGTCQWYANAWRWSGSRWTYTWLNRGTDVYASPYGGGWMWAWTGQTGWLAVRQGDIVAYRSTTAKNFTLALNPVPHDPYADGGSNVTGTGQFLLDGTTLTASIHVQGLDPLPHVMHIHGKENAGEIATCPGADRRNKLVDDGLIETVEGIDDYGPVQLSFTTSGDTSANSAFALERFAWANPQGHLAYQRTVTVPAGLAGRMSELHVVIHGADLNRNGRYDGRVTALGQPLEAELPLACGTIDRSY